MKHLNRMKLIFVIIVTTFNGLLKFNRSLHGTVFLYLKKKSKKLPYILHGPWNNCIQMITNNFSLHLIRYYIESMNMILNN